MKILIFYVQNMLSSARPNLDGTVFGDRMLSSLNFWILGMKSGYFRSNSLIDISSEFILLLCKIVILYLSGTSN